MIEMTHRNTTMIDIVVEVCEICEWEYERKSANKIHVFADQDEFDIIMSSDIVISKLILVKSEMEN